MVRSTHLCVVAFVRVANRAFSMWCHMWCKCRMHSHSVLCAVECAFRQNYTNPIFTIICIICLSTMVALLHFLWERLKGLFTFAAFEPIFDACNFHMTLNLFICTFLAFWFLIHNFAAAFFIFASFFPTYILFFLSKKLIDTSFGPCPFVHNNFGIFMANDFLNRMQCTKEENEHRMNKKKI